ncbi:MAG TPA: Smr/MutS family protein [Candidatus Dormibacteraeota bacterium]|nr:Smr/MutS family protein [Candidatus Dormibacteraeota bacterium]
MARTTEELLEFDALLEILRGFSTAAPGRRALGRLRFSEERQTLEAGFARIGDAVEYLASGSELGLGGMADPEPWLNRVAQPSVVLDAGQLLDAAGLVETAFDTRATLGALRTRWPRLAELGERLPDLRPLAVAIRRAILPGGEIADDATPELKRIRTGRVRVRERTLDLLRAVLRRLSETGGEEDYVTLRNDRYVIPVRASIRRSAPGVVHGASSSGQTLFVEPLEAVEQNNELVRLAEAEAAEIARILDELTGRVRASRGALERTAEELGEIDSIFARARFARRFECALPRFSPDGRLRLTAARHPVLEQALGRRGRAMVPVTIELGGADTVMVISGPNAGGKTVVLKTVGLAALSAQTGIPVAAGEAELPLADRVLADIGDEQSITADLSTFSAHMLNLRSMLETAGERSLILIDEIGTGTAPEEGSALAVALLEEFRGRRALTFATTHHDRLKTYALATEGVVNAAVEFDVQSLAPTYRLLLGLPGTSSGIAIAQRLGLPPEVIERARREMAPESLEAATLVDDLHRMRERLDAGLRETAAQRARLEEERRELRTEWTERQRRRIEELEREFRETLENAEKEIRRLSAEVQDRKLRAAIEKQTARRMATIRSEARSDSDAAVLAFRGESQKEMGGAIEPAPPPIDPDRLTAGTAVRVRGLEKPVVVRQRQGRMVEVQAGPLRMKIPVEDILGAAGEPAARAKPPGEGITVQAGSEAGEEINVIGQTVEEAIRLVDRFLDRAALAGKARIRIVHGYGTGALRRGLGEFLKTHPLVETISAEARERGGEAVTVVALKD